VNASIVEKDSFSHFKLCATATECSITPQNSPNSLAGRNAFRWLQLRKIRVLIDISQQTARFPRFSLLVPMECKLLKFKFNPQISSIALEYLLDYLLIVPPSVLLECVLLQNFRERS
jgi:hypothetical protein